MTEQQVSTKWYRIAGLTGFITAAGSVCAESVHYDKELKMLAQRRASIFTKPSVPKGFWIGIGVGVALLATSIIGQKLDKKA